MAKNKKMAFFKNAIARNVQKIHITKGGGRMDSEEIVREHQLIFDLAKSNKKRIDNLEEEQKELRSLTQAVSQMVVEQKNMRDDLVEMKDDVKQIKEKPARRWDSMAEKALNLITAAVVAWMLAQIGL